MDEYGLRHTCQWAGNSPATAMANYALVRKTDFVDAGSSANKSDAISPSDTKSDAVLDGTERRASTESPIKKAPLSTEVQQGYLGMDFDALKVAEEGMSFYSGLITRK